MARSRHALLARRAAAWGVLLPHQRFCATFTASGTATFIPDDPSQPRYSANFAAWSGENCNLRNGTATETFNVRLTGTDGSAVTGHAVVHISVSARGVGPLTFEATA